jgi:hypothetical protein
MPSLHSPLATGAVLLDGFLAGASFDRTLIQLPAFRRAGVQHWAAFSRKADLGNRALFWYPTLAIAGTALSIGAALEGRSKNVPAMRAACLFTAAALAAAGLLTTIGAAPNMLRLRKIGDGQTELQRSFDGFAYWQKIRGTLQSLAFVAIVFALISEHD